jgi:hypothetical protein
LPAQQIVPDPVAQPALRPFALPADAAIAAKKTNSRDLDSIARALASLVNEPETIFLHAGHMLFIFRLTAR